MSIFGSCLPQNRQIQEIPISPETDDLNAQREFGTQIISKKEYVESEQLNISSENINLEDNQIESCKEWIKRKGSLGNYKSMIYTKVPIDKDVTEFANNKIYHGTEVNTSLDGKNWELKRHCPYYIIDSQYNLECVLIDEDYSAVYARPVSNCYSKKFGRIQLAKEKNITLKISEVSNSDSNVNTETKHLESLLIQTDIEGNYSQSCSDWIKENQLYGEYEKEIYTKIASGYDVSSIRYRDAYQGGSILTSLNGLFWEVKDHCPYLLGSGNNSQCFLMPIDYTATDLKPVSECVSNNYGKLQLAKENYKVIRKIVKE